MNDVSAILLSSGEPFAVRARRSVEAQTYRIDEIILIENISPFHRAFAEGVSRVRSPFFVQVDADMVLDPTCVEQLRSAMEDDVGMVCGNLRDPLAGQVEGVKLIRSSVAKRVQHLDRVSSETEFVRALERQGGRLKYIGRGAPGSGLEHQTYGDHLPDYSPHYTFQKHRVEGLKYRYRGARSALYSKLHSLGQSQHEMMPLARIALGHGFFLDANHDIQGPPQPQPEADEIMALLASDRELPNASLFPLSRYGTLRHVFHAFVNAGAEMSRAGAGRTVHEVLAQLAAENRGWPVMVATLAFGHGIVSGELDQGGVSADEQKLRAFANLGIHGNSPLVRQVRANIERLYYALPQVLVPGRAVPWWRRVPRW